MKWENVLKAEKVFILSEEMSMGSDDVIGVFRSREALDKYLLERHPEFEEKGMSDEEALEDMMLTYDYNIDEAEMKG
tara:strand:+ start:199 stop:429 length:231 start_codon:yes stop_codon:yes gene_type:complete